MINETLTYRGCVYRVLSANASRVLFVPHYYTEAAARGCTRAVYDCSPAAWAAGTPFSKVEQASAAT